MALILGVTALSGIRRVEAGEAPLASAVVASLILGLGHGLAAWGPGSISRVRTNPWLTLVAALMGRPVSAVRRWRRGIVTPPLLQEAES